jgi:hypothetical protein
MLRYRRRLDPYSYTRRRFRRLLWQEYSPVPMIVVAVIVLLTIAGLMARH